MKSKRILGMTSIQITILSILACFGLTLIGSLAGLIFNGTSIFSIFAYKPNPDDAFSNAAGYALSEMYAQNPSRYGCEETDNKRAVDWYKIKVSDLGNAKYQVIGAMKAIDEFCLYNTGYFAATVFYDSNTKDWDLSGKVNFSNPCMTLSYAVTENDFGICTTWKYGWTPDMSWTPLLETSSQAYQPTQKIEPTPTPTALPPTLTPTPKKEYLSGGDIGKMWSYDGHSIGLISVYKTDAIEGAQPYEKRLEGNTEGYKEFMVVNLQFERFNPGYDVFDNSGFFLTSYTDDNYEEYQVKMSEIEPLELFRLNYPEKVTKSIAFVVMSNSHNFVLCYGITPGIYVSGEIASWCGAEGYEFKFGD